MSDKSTDEWSGLLFIALIAAGIWWWNSGSEPSAPAAVASFPAPKDYSENASATVPLVSPQAAPSPPPLPTHKYDFEDKGVYGYVAAVSDEERAKGRATGELSLFAYRGSKQGVHRLTMYNDAMVRFGDYECETPCRVIRSLSGETVVRRIPYNPSSILGAAFADALAGRLRINGPRREQRVNSRLSPSQLVVPPPRSTQDQPVIDAEPAPLENTQVPPSGGASTRE
jgi:hypothetical protein